MIDLRLSKNFQFNIFDHIDKNCLSVIISKINPSAIVKFDTLEFFIGCFIR